MASFKLTQTGQQIQNDLNLLDSNNGTSGQVLTADGSGGASWQTPAGGGSWGSITGTLSNQTDLQSALDTKANCKEVAVSLSQIISQSPVTFQFTEEQQAILEDASVQILKLTGPSQILGYAAYMYFQRTMGTTATDPYIYFVRASHTFDSNEELSDFGFYAFEYDSSNGQGILSQKSVSALISGKEDTSNKVTSISASSTDTQYPSAKCVYDELEDKAGCATLTFTTSQIVSQDPLTVECTAEQIAVLEDASIPVIKVMSDPVSLFRCQYSYFVRTIEESSSSPDIYFLRPSHFYSDGVLDDFGFYAIDYDIATHQAVLSNMLLSDVLPTEEITLTSSQIVSSSPLAFSLTASQKAIIKNTQYSFVNIILPDTVSQGADSVYMYRDFTFSDEGIYYFFSSHKNTSDHVLTNIGMYVAEYFDSNGYLYLLNAFAESTNNKVTVITSSPTDTQYPSAKAVYDAMYALNEALSESIEEKSTVSAASTGSSTTTVNYITIDDTEYKIGGESVEAFTAAEVDTIFDGVA